MAQTTVELRTLIENVNYNLFNFTYKFDDQTFKSELEQSIIDFFYDYEIAFETPDMFTRKFQARWNRIIPFYNEMYNTTVLAYNPLQNLSITETVDNHSTNDSTQTSTLSDSRNGSTTTDGTTGNDTTVTNNLTNSTTADVKHSDYPQQPIAGGDYLQGEESTTNTESNTGTVTHNVSGTNNTTVTDSDTSSSNGSLTNNVTVQENNTKTTDGIKGTTYQDLILKQRDTLINIKNKVIEEMKPCFILTF